MRRLRLVRGGGVCSEWVSHFIMPVNVISKSAQSKETGTRAARPCPAARLMRFTPSLRPRGDLTRSRRAAARIPAAQAALANCRLCAHQCGVDRTESPAGLCHAGPRAGVFCAQLEVSDELMITPTFAIALSGCDLRCDFCITGRESWNSRAGTRAEVSLLAQQARRALSQGARSVMILGGEPTIHLPTVLRLVAELPNDAVLVWKTNGHGSGQARALLAGLFDVWVIDYKFGNDRCARRLARIPDYSAIVRENLLWAQANTKLIVRHLLMPGHLDCCWRPVAAWLASRLPGVPVNLRSGFWPAWRSSRHPELRGTVEPAAAALAGRHARALGLRLIN
jgi:putative pyruvate formate lyase activating enzyme